MKAVKVHREGRGPYTMRHVFRTIADEALDRVAIDAIMGHSDPSMGGHYRERIDEAGSSPLLNTSGLGCSAKPPTAARPTKLATAPKRSSYAMPTIRPITTTTMSGRR